MRRMIMIIRQKGEDLPKVKTLAEAGFHISGAVDYPDNKETETESKKAPCPKKQAGGDDSCQKY